MAFARRFEPAMSYASFTLGLSDHTGFVLLPRLVDHISAVALSVSLRIVSAADCEGVVSQLDGAEADVTVGVPPRLPPGSRVLTLPSFEEDFVRVLRRGHPAATRASDHRSCIEEGTE